MQVVELSSWRILRRSKLASSGLLLRFGRCGFGQLEVIDLVFQGSPAQTCG